MWAFPSKIPFHSPQNPIKLLVQQPRLYTIAVLGKQNTAFLNFSVGEEDDKIQFLNPMKIQGIGCL